MFPFGKKTRNVLFFFAISTMLLVGCGQDNGDNNDNNNNVGNLDGNFGAGGVLLIEAQGQLLDVSPDQDAKNIDFQIREQDRQREKEFVNRHHVINSLNSKLRAAGDDSVNAVAFDANNNKLVYAGISDGAITKVLFAVSDINGDLDNTFGGDGRVAIDIGSAAVGDVIINDVAVQADGKIVAVGTFEDSVTLIRVNVDGTLDVTFGGTGVVQNNAAANEGNAIIITDINDGNGEQIIVGATDDQAGVDVAEIVTFDLAGNTLANFSTNANNSTTNKIAIDGNDNIIGVGLRGGGSQIFKMNNVGVLDNTFGGNDGILDIAGANFLAVTTDPATDEIIVAGVDQTTTDAFMQRFDATGIADPAFNGGDPLIFEPKVGGTNQFVFDVFLRNTDIVAVGSLDAAQDGLGFITIINDNGSVRILFETERLINNGDANDINENLFQGVVVNNQIIAVGNAIEADNNGIDGVAIRIQN